MSSIHPGQWRRLSPILDAVLPMSADASAPYFSTGLVGILAAASVAGYGAFTSLGRQRLFNG